MKIAVFGATSQIATDLIFNLLDEDAADLTLFGRDIDVLQQHFKQTSCTLKTYAEFANSQRYEVLVNFVGVGDPARAKAMGKQIVSVTESYDNIALRYIEANPETKYIFLSSGAVFGSDFSQPVSEQTLAQLNINQPAETDWYSLAKICAEVRHRAYQQNRIVDLRVYNYFSASQNLDAKFLISDIVRAIRDKSILKTSAENIIRDFIGPRDFLAIFKTALQPDVHNIALDCFSAAPVNKQELLETLAKEYGLQYRVDSDYGLVNATGKKANYYSTNHLATKFGYKPQLSAMDSVLEEIAKLGLANA